MGKENINKRVPQAQKPPKEMREVKRIKKGGDIIQEFLPIKKVIEK